MAEDHFQVVMIHVGYRHITAMRAEVSVITIALLSMHAQECECHPLPSFGQTERLVVAIMILSALGPPEGQPREGEGTGFLLILSFSGISPTASASSQ